MADRMITLEIKRQENQKSEPYWQTFRIPWQPNANVISCLMDVQRNPVTQDGKQVEPVVWDCNCLEEVCGACTMVVNGRVRQACSAIIDRLGDHVRLEPMSKFPVVRDLAVDRSRMFENLKKVYGWNPVDGYHDLGPGQRIPEAQQQISYKLSECMTCGCCLEACPQFGIDNQFVGAAAVSQARYFNMHPSGKGLKEKRLKVLMSEGGIADCGNAQNCVEVCPKGIPLTESIAEIGKQVTFQFFKNIFASRD